MAPCQGSNGKHSTKENSLILAILLQDTAEFLNSISSLRRKQPRLCRSDDTRCRDTRSGEAKGHHCGRALGGNSFFVSSDSDIADIQFCEQNGSVLRVQRPRASSTLLTALVGVSRCQLSHTIVSEVHHHSRMLKRVVAAIIATAP